MTHYMAQRFFGFGDAENVRFVIGDIVCDIRTGIGIYFAENVYVAQIRRGIQHSRQRDDLGSGVRIVFVFIGDHDIVGNDPVNAVFAHDIIGDVHIHFPCR